jgi:PTH1 family peptidyl-tRNA hydrolase
MEEQADHNQQKSASTQETLPFDINRESSRKKLDGDHESKRCPTIGLDSLGTKIRLIVGLGNPGSEYVGTRHNIGFAVLDALAKKYDVSFSFESKWNAEIAKIPAISELHSDLVLMKPKTFMNLSGTAVACYARFFHLTPSQILVVLDDVALPLGRLRLRCSGSAGGQRGLESILTHFSTQEVPRLRLGVSAPEDLSKEDPETHSKALSHYVLSRFSKEELPLVEASIKQAGDALEYLHQEGLDKTMNFYNP